MILALLFFCISGAVILQVFASANGIVQRNRRSDSAVLCAQSCAESYTVSGDLSKTLITVFGQEYTSQDGVYTIPLDGECRPSESGSVTLTLTEQSENGAAGSFSTVTAVFSHSGEEFYRLSFSAYTPFDGGDRNE